MKTIQELKLQKPVYLNRWKDKIDMISDFTENISMSAEDYNRSEAPYANTEYWLKSKAQMNKLLQEYSKYNVLFASYGEDNYSGDAWVLFEQDGKLYEVNGSHCSCFGLEGQWEPEETALEAIKLRLDKGSLGASDYSGNYFADDLRIFLGDYE